MDRKQNGPLATKGGCEVSSDIYVELLEKEIKDDHNNT